MTRLFVLMVIMIGVVATARAQDVDDHLNLNQTKARKTVVDEVHVEQEKGQISRAAKSLEPAANPANSVPEGKAAAVQNGSTSPATCDARNASSPACYTATQQGRGK